MKRSLLNVLGEAVFIGVCTFVLYAGLHVFVENIYIKMFLIGFLTHVLFEWGPFGNVNKKWCERVF